MRFLLPLTLLAIARFAPEPESAVSAAEATGAAAAESAARVWPASLELVGPGAAHRVLSPEPLVSRAPGVVRIVEDPDGGPARVVAVADGEGEIETAGVRVPVLVRGTGAAPPVDFDRDVVPLLSRMGCNGSGCHGSAIGRGGFKLSLFGTDPETDHATLTRAFGGRRIDRAVPERSLFLLKPTRQVPHEGGKIFREGDATHATLLAWAREGFARSQASPALEHIEARAADTVTGEFPAAGASTGLAGPTGAIVVRAHYADGSSRDVTDLARYSSNDEALASVDEDGQVEVIGRGETAIMVRFGSEVAAVRVGRAFARAASDAGERPLARLAVANSVDEHVARALERLAIEPSPPADDATFARRAYLDVTGQLPTPAEVRAFLAAPDRAALVERLIASPAFDAYWAYRLDQWFGVGTEQTDAAAFHGWLAGRVREPWTETARLALEAGGLEPAANFYRLTPDPKVTAENVGRVFLGTRWMCAQCHDHPFESFRQSDYYGVAAVFSRLRHTPEGIVAIDRGDLVFPRDGLPALPRFPDGSPCPPEGDRRPAIAAWLAAEPQLGRALANRIWALFFGRGLVHPVDDFRSSNPPTHPELLTELGALDSIPAIVRAIAASSTYALGGPTEANAADDRYVSHARVRPLDAEVLLDAVARASGVRDAWPDRSAGTRAIELGDVTTESYALDVCGRGRADFAGTLARELHFLNGDAVLPKLAGVAKLVGLDDPELVTELYLRTLSRPPSAAELDHWTGALRRGARDEVAEDLLWALLNSREFATCH